MKVEALNVRLTAPAPVALGPAAAKAQVYLRATTAAQPGPVLRYRAAVGQAWAAQKTTRAGQDVYVAPFAGAGQYALFFPVGSSAGRSSALPWLLLGLAVVLVVSGVVLRVRAAGPREE